MNKLILLIYFGTVSFLKGKGEQKSPHYSLLHGPRLHFSGEFIADASTVNNKILNYNIHSFMPHHSLGKAEGGHGGANPSGTNLFMLKDVLIRRVCYANQTCTDDDSLVGNTIKDYGAASAARMVDIDPLDFNSTQIWGLSITIPHVLQASAGTLTMRQIWKRSKLDRDKDRSFSALFHGVLKNIKFLGDGHSSPCVQQIKKKLIESEQMFLSIRFVLHRYEYKHLGGNIYGTIGYHDDSSSVSSLTGRVLSPLEPEMYSEVVFSVDQENKVITFDFGNSFPTDVQGNVLNEKKVSFLVAYTKQDDSFHQKPTRKNLENYEVLGNIPTEDHDWLTKAAGFLTIEVSKEQIKFIKNNPLRVIKVKEKKMKGERTNITVILAERCDGLQLVPKDEFVFRKESGEVFDVQFIALSFGIRKSGIPIQFNFQIPKRNLNSTCCTPIFRLPGEISTDKDGIAKARFHLPVLNSPRKFTDGQIYHVFYFSKNICNQVEVPEPKNDRANYLVLKIYDYLEYPNIVTWVDHVYPIFLQYANLYPVMKGTTFDISNYHSVVNFRSMIRDSMSLPTNHSSFMPVTRDLSKRKRRMILDWLSSDRPILGKVEKLINIQRLRCLLQTALEIEHSTIPPYLTALWSIKDGYNREVHKLIKTIVKQEMMHMGLVANLINAVGGHPSFNHSSFIPSYPTQLPGGIAPNLIVPLGKLSLKLIKNVFLKIEQPDTNVKHREFRKAIFENIKLPYIGQFCKKRVKRRVCNKFSATDFQGSFKGCPTEVTTYFESIINDDEIMGEKSDAKELFKYKDGIASFYTHILFVIAYLTDCGKDNSIFSGDPHLQLITDSSSYGHGQMIKVTNYVTAVAAIQIIIEEGEGTSECDPAVHYLDANDDLSHYSMFHTIVKRHRVSIKHPMSIAKDVISNSSNYECKDTYYDYTGSRVSYIPEATWPILTNARQSDYKNGSLVWIKTNIFARLYNRLLGALHKTFNGEQSYFTNAKFLMYAVDYYGRQLVRLPMDEKVSSFVGPTACPVFKWFKTDVTNLRTKEHGKVVQPKQFKPKEHQIKRETKHKKTNKYNTPVIKIHEKVRNQPNTIEKYLDLLRRAQNRNNSLRRNLFKKRKYNQIYYNENLRLEEKLEYFEKSIESLAESNELALYLPSNNYIDDAFVHERQYAEQLTEGSEKDSLEAFMQNYDEVAV